MSETLTIRAASGEDWPAIERILVQCGLPLDGARDHLHGFVVAERGGAITGCAALERYGRAALLRSVAVLPAERGTGLGERLVRHLIDAARKEGVADLVLLTTTADRWFPRFGFRPIHRSAIPAALEASAELRGACPSSAVVLSLALQA